MKAYQVDVEKLMDQLLDMGFAVDTKQVFPPTIKRGDIRINYGKKCINVWDGEDKNSVGIVRLITADTETRTHYTTDPEHTAKHVEDLIEAKLVETIKFD